MKKPADNGSRLRVGLLLQAWYTSGSVRMLSSVLGGASCHRPEMIDRYHLVREGQGLSVCGQTSMLTAAV